MAFLKTFFAKKNLSRILIILLIVPSLYFAVPAKKADAFFGFAIVHDPINWIQNAITAIEGGVTAGGTTVNAANTTAQNVKIFLLDGIAVALARMTVQAITAQTVNWINSGFQGNPGYVTDPQQFFTDIGDRTVIAELGANGGLLNKICTPFQPQIRLALVQNYLSQQDQLGQCSIQGIIQNYDAFTNGDFSQGGWNGWFSMTQGSQNNPYGAYLYAQNELNVRIANQQGIKAAQLNQNAGFLNYKKCTTSHGTSATGQGVPDTTAWDACMADPQHAGDSQYCDTNAPITYTAIQNTDSELPDYSDPTAPATAGYQTCTTVTPGSVISTQLNKVFGSSVDQLNLTNSINQVVGALMIQAFKGIFGGITGGLRGLSQSSSGGTPSLVNQLLPSSAQSQAQASTTLQGIKSNIPSSLTPAIDPNTPTTPVAPIVDITALTAEAQAQAATVQNQVTTPVCGDNICGNGEMSTCPNDCSFSGGTCGNNICEGIEWQTCSSDCVGVTP